MVAINGIPAKIILDKLRYGMALKNNEENYFERAQEARFYVNLLLDLRFRSDFTVKFADQTIKFKGVSDKAIRSLRGTSNEISYKLLNEKNKIGYLRLKTLVINKRAKLDSCLASLFKTLKAQHIDKLIIDIRGDGGGSTQLSRDVFDYITDNPYQMDIGEEYLKNGKRLFEKDSSVSIPKVKPNKFSGNTVLLNDIGSYSSTHMMANTFKYYKMGVVVGQVSAEPLYISGEVEQLNTSHTGSVVYYPTANFYLPGYQKQSITFFLPDYEVYPTVIERVKGKDAALALAVKLLGKD